MLDQIDVDRGSAEKAGGQDCEQFQNSHGSIIHFVDGASGDRRLAAKVSNCEICVRETFEDEERFSSHRSLGGAAIFTAQVDLSRDRKGKKESARSVQNDGLSVWPVGARIHHQGRFASKARSLAAPACGRQARDDDYSGGVDQQNGWPVLRAGGE